jgi:cytidylate kinase
MSSERVLGGLEHAVQHWEKSRASAAERPSGNVPAHWTVAVSREAGARGSSIARRAGELLGWPVYDRELLQMIADEKGLRVKLLESVDEKHTSWLESCLEGLATGPHVSEVAFVRYLVESLFSLAALGNCVIVGRASALILPPDSTLRMRLTGAEKDRIAYISRHFGLPEKDAAAWVKQTDHDRTWFVQEYFHKDANDLTQYDLVINTSRFSTEAAAQLMAQAVHQVVSAGVKVTR